MKMTKWTSVDDDMPKVGVGVIVWLGDIKSVDVDHVEACVETGDKFFANNGSKVTHWMYDPGRG